jgi:hypothetical protein
MNVINVIEHDNGVFTVGGGYSRKIRTLREQFGLTTEFASAFATETFGIIEKLLDRIAKRGAEAVGEVHQSRDMIDQALVRITEPGNRINAEICIHPEDPENWFMVTVRVGAVARFWVDVSDSLTMPPGNPGDLVVLLEPESLH